MYLILRITYLYADCCFLSGKTPVLRFCGKIIITFIAPCDASRPMAELIFAACFVCCTRDYANLAGLVGCGGSGIVCLFRVIRRHFSNRCSCLTSVSSRDAARACTFPTSALGAGAIRAHPRTYALSIPLRRRPAMRRSACAARVLSSAIALSC